MTVFEPAETLRNHRPLLLSAEAIGWLHMVGKAKGEFLENHGGQKNGYNYNTKGNEALLDLIVGLESWTKETCISGNIVLPDSFEDFFLKHAMTESHKNIVGLLQAAHAMASGIEKNLPKSTSGYLNQDVTHMWLSSAFGKPVRNLLSDRPDVLTVYGWEQLRSKIERLLEDLASLGRANPPHTIHDIEGWWHWREEAIGEDGWLRKAFTSTLAETRLPNNDVTLFDQSYVAAALFKSAVAGAILERDFDWKKTNLKQDTQWRLLTVGIGADHYESRAVKIGDWTGAKMRIDTFFEKVRKRFEVDLALGTLVFKDESLCVFTFPGEQANNSSSIDYNKWKTYVQEVVDTLAKEFETPPYCHITEKASRSLTGIRKEIQEARNTMAIPNFRSIKTKSGGSTNGHVCPVCRVRTNDSDSKQKPCETCRSRRTHRRADWLNGNLGSDSIWISEVADANDRLALITMSLDIAPWLDGSALDSLRTQCVDDWASKNSKAGKLLPENGDDLVEFIKAAFGKGNQAVQKRSLLKKKIAPGLEDKNGRQTSWNDFYSSIVQDRSNAPKWDTLNEHQRAQWLAHQLFCKLSSPGRIYRFERQAEDFFNELIARFREIAASAPSRIRTKRLLLTPANGSSDCWEDNKVYNGHFGGAPVSLMYRTDLGGFVTICNLERLSELNEGAKIVDLKYDDENYPTKTELVVKNVLEPSGHLGVYHPIIRMSLSPLRFRVLVPLTAASDCVEAARAAWTDEFSRVWDRIPLRVGVVAFPRMVPFQAVIEATRNVERDLGERNEETWLVQHARSEDSCVSLSLKRAGLGTELVTVPTKMPDGRPDVFYPYAEVDDRTVRYSKDFAHPDGRVYRHMTDLKTGDGIKVRSSLVATVFLDSTAQRFVATDIRDLYEWERKRRIWSLLSQAASGTSALKGLWSILIEHRDNYQGPDGRWGEGGEAAWNKLVETMLAERMSLTPSALKAIREAAKDGVLDWTLNWHLTVLKKLVKEK